MLPTPTALPINMADINGYSNKEILSLFVLPQLNSLGLKVDLLSARAPLSEEFIKEFGKAQDEIIELRKWKSRMIGAISVIAFVLAPTIAVVAASLVGRF